MWICLCEAVNSSTICDAIEAGARSVQAIGEVCGAGTVCGKCKRNIALLLDRGNHQRPHADGCKGEADRWTTAPRW